MVQSSQSHYQKIIMESRGRTISIRVAKETWESMERYFLHAKGKVNSMRFRTDNSIKNHFYSTLRRSLRRLNKLSGEKNSTNHLRQIKPSVLTNVLQYIYDHEKAGQPTSGVIDELKGKKLIYLDLPSLIFQLASFKPVKRNMG